MIRKISGLLIIAMLVASTLCAQQKEGVTSKIYEIRNRKAADIARLLVGMDVELVKGSINDAFNTFTVRASEEGHEAVAELINKYDFPRKTIKFQFFLIKATASGEISKNGLTEKVQKVIKEISGLTKYKSFEVIDSPFVLVQEGNTASLTGNGAYDYSLMFHVQDGMKLDDPNPQNQIRIDRFQISFSESKAGVRAETLKKSGASPPARSPSQSLDTSFTMFEGDMVVIGASQIESGDKTPGVAVITIVTAEILP